MRNYPDMKDKYDVEEIKNMKAEDWMLELLKKNPEYTSWGNYEDYMCNKNGWASPVELESINELWELDEYNEVVNFYFDIIRKSHECEECEGTGLNKETKELSDSWYDYLNHGNGWEHHLTQDEVDALWENNRLCCDFKEKPTAEQVNTKSYGRGLLHDSINHWICCETRAKRLGVYGKCPCCSNGRIYDEDKAHVELQLWGLHPRKGCSYGIRITRLEKGDISKAVEYLKEARDRNNDRFSRL